MRKIEVKPGYKWDVYVDGTLYYSFDGTNLIGEILGDNCKNDDFPASNIEEIIHENIKATADMFVEAMKNEIEKITHWDAGKPNSVCDELSPDEISELKTQLATALMKHFDVSKNTKEGNCMEFIHIKDGILICDNASDAERYMEYASKHGHNVKFTDTGTSKMSEIALMFKRAGFGVDVQAKSVHSPDGLHLPDMPVFVFLHRENKDYPYLSQARDFGELRSCYSEDTLKEFENSVKEYMESNDRENPDEYGVEPIIAWLEGLITFDDLKDVREPDYVTKEPVLMEDREGKEIHYPNFSPYTTVIIQHDDDKTVIMPGYGNFNIESFARFLVHQKQRQKQSQKEETYLCGVLNDRTIYVTKDHTVSDVIDIIKEKQWYELNMGDVIEDTSYATETAIHKILATYPIRLVEQDFVVCEPCAATHTAFMVEFDNNASGTITIENECINKYTPLDLDMLYQR